MCKHALALVVVVVVVVVVPGRKGVDR